ncbi:CHASE2 domain-containing serine/threonine-protein kinase [Thermodesulfobacteriota bacterium]
MKAAFENIIAKTSLNRSDLLRGIIISAVFILFSFQSFSVFESIERFFYGIEMRFALTPSAGSGKIAIVNIDEKSLDQIGPWPWQRSKIAEMIKILSDNGARLIGLDLEGLNNRAPNQGLQEIKNLYSELLARNALTDEQDSWLKGKLSEIEGRLDNDRLLEKAVNETGIVILPVSGRNDESNSVLDQDAFSTINRIKVNLTGFDPEGTYKVKNLIMPFPEIASNSLGLGHIDQSPDKEMVGRKHLLFFNFNNNIIPSMAFKLALEYLGEGNNTLSIKKEGITLSKNTIPAPNGEILIRFKGARRSYPYYSYVNILKVKQVPSLFEDKIVLIGRTGRGAETINTPVDTALPRVEFIANVIDNILSEGYVERPDAMTYIEAIILLALIMIFSHVFPKTTHINRISITLGLCFVVIVTGVISFITLDVWFKSIYIFSAIIILYLVITIRDLVISQKLMEIQSEEFKESSRMLGLSFQSQGLLDLAFEKFRKCDLDNSMKDVIYNLGLDYERKRMVNKAISVYEYIAEKDSNFRDLKTRVPKLRAAIGAVGGKKGKKEERILVVDDLEIKPTVGRYEIIKEIGQGAMGVVYEANDPKINRHLAIKTIRFSDEFKDEKIREIKIRFFKEAEIAGKLSHPAIVSIYDAGEDYDLTYLAMEYLEGTDLRKFCKKGSLQPLRKVLYIVSEVALALEHAHNMGVIHRDIKPGNIMLLKNGKVSVTDFGIAKAISSSETKSGVVLGTPNYMSPEQINGKNIDGRSDIFALGVVLFELLAGDVPFHGKNITSLLYQITQAKHPDIRELNPKVPKVCAQIIDKALEKKPKNRFQKGTEMAKYLKATLNKMNQVEKNRS